MHSAIRWCFVKIEILLGLLTFPNGIQIEAMKKTATVNQHKWKQSVSYMQTFLNIMHK